MTKLSLLFNLDLPCGEEAFILLVEKSLTADTMSSITMIVALSQVFFHVGKQMIVRWSPNQKNRENRDEESN